MDVHAPHAHEPFAMPHTQQVPADGSLGVVHMPQFHVAAAAGAGAGAAAASTLAWAVSWVLVSSKSPIIDSRTSPRMRS